MRLVILVEALVDDDVAGDRVEACRELRGVIEELPLLTCTGNHRLISLLLARAHRTDKELRSLGLRGASRAL